jgi:hypothetical protein
MTDWIEHTTDTCPVDPETVVEVVLQFGASIKAPSPPKPARRFIWTEDGSITHYRIITPAKPPEPPEPEMTEPDLITLRLECMKMAVSHFSILDREQAADILLRYVLNGSVDKA